jgi:hypothetical protein
MEKQMKSNNPSASVKRPQRSQTSSWHYTAVAVMCCAVLVAGFFFAARQHFSSMEYGLQNSRLRRDLDELQSEQRRLLLNREVTMSPTELRKAIKRLGYVDAPAQVEIIKSQNPVAQKSVADIVQPAKFSTDKPANKVVKTVINVPAGRSLMDKQARRESTNQKKDRT